MWWHLFNTSAATFPVELLQYILIFLAFSDLWLTLSVTIYSKTSIMWPFFGKRKKLCRIIEDFRQNYIDILVHKEMIRLWGDSELQRWWIIEVSLQIYPVDYLLGLLTWLHSVYHSRIGRCKAFTPLIKRNFWHYKIIFHGLQQVNHCCWSHPMNAQIQWL